MMKCFYYLKDRNRSRVQKSAPILNKVQRQSDRVTTKSSCSPRRSIPELYQEKAQNLRVFTFSELKQATNNFSRLLKIGEGGFGSVYKGAIKPGHKQWVAEVQFLGVVEHPNLVKLIGYCGVDGERGIQRLLVYEYMPNKSLEHHLFHRGNPPLSWQTRLQILLGAAQGLAYLHQELEIQVIYRDFKSSNVLLDGNFKAKLSDFGLAREGPKAGNSHVSTVVVGTYGYAAPDYIKTGHLTSKSDVWSFGVVLNEILTGRRSLERDLPKSEQKLLEWVRQYPADTRKFGMIMDSRLENHYSLSAARKIAKLADTCLVKRPKDRPKMSKVVEVLKQVVGVESVESPPTKYAVDGVEDEEEKPVGASESARRRIAHLAKISEHIGSVSRRRFMMMQRAKVT
ncbi:hypothetical protein ACS0TY_003517 [Phlomoides rotata]